jgi:hypothetical protein
MDHLVGYLSGKTFALVTNGNLECDLLESEGANSFRNDDFGCDAKT